YTKDARVEVSRTGRDQVELAGRAYSCDCRTRRRAQPHDGSARRRADRRDDVMVELAGELTRVMVQLSGEWLLYEIRSFVHFRSFFQ
ncbi:hypothetical protein HID58_066138, partial [Brassica napus]